MSLNPRETGNFALGVNERRPWKARPNPTETPRRGSKTPKNPPRWVSFLQRAQPGAVVEPSVESLTLVSDTESNTRFIVCVCGVEHGICPTARIFGSSRGFSLALSVTVCLGSFLGFLCSLFKKNTTIHLGRPPGGMIAF
jgi:hypothetical protein